MFPRLVFVDTETTGLSPRYCRVIDIGVAVWENGKIIETWQSLVNSQVYISPTISRITGITEDQLVNAPDFSDIAWKLKSYLSSGIMVAHNASFDFNFLNAEYQKIDDLLEVERLCTVQLSRRLYPNYRSHGLSAIIDRFGINVSDRHRALPDALATVEFFDKSLEKFGTSKVLNILNSLVKKV